MSFAQSSQSSSPTFHTASPQEHLLVHEGQSQHITRLRTELLGVRTGIQRIVSGLQELGEDPVGTSSSLQPRTMPPSRPLATASEIIGRSVSQASANPALPYSLQDSAWAPSTSATSPTRYFSESAQRQGQSDLAARQRAFLESNQASPHLPAQSAQTSSTSRPNDPRYNANEPPYSVLGSREEIESPDYQSPVGAMFGRAWDRYRTAENERRQVTISDHNDRDDHPAELAGNTPSSLVPHGHLASFEPPAPRERRNPFDFTPRQTQRTNLPGWRRRETASGSREAQHYQDEIRRHAESTIREGLTDSRADLESLQRHVPSTTSNGRSARRPYRMSDDELAFHHGLPAGYLAWAQHQHAGGPLTGHHAHPPPPYYPYDSGSDSEPAVTFDTQERPPPMKSEAMVRDMSCSICKEHMVDTVVMPCMHAVMCNWCAELQIPGKRDMPTIARDRTAKCPLCRQRVKEKRKIYHS